MHARLVVGVCGGSGAGKRRIIDQYLVPALAGAGLILEHDWYYHELPTLFVQQNVTERDDINYDIPDAYENALLIRDIQALRQGRSIDVRRYQKGVGMREEVPMRLAPHEVIIVDGMMVLAVPELAAQMDIKAFVHADPEVRLRRRVARDLYFSSEEESLLRFERDVLPAHIRYVEPSRAIADFVLDNSQDDTPAVGTAQFVEAVVLALQSARLEGERTL